MKYFIGSYFKDTSEIKLAWQTSYLRNIVRAFFWFLNPIVCIAISLFIAAIIDKFAFQNLQNYVAISVLTFFFLWILFVFFYVVGVFIFTRGLRVEYNKPLSKESKAMLIKAGATEEQLNFAELAQRRNIKLAFVKTYQRMPRTKTWKIVLFVCFAIFGTYNSFLEILSVENLHSVTAIQVLYCVAAIFMDLLAILLIAVHIIQLKVK